MLLLHLTPERRLRYLQRVAVVAKFEERPAIEARFAALERDVAQRHSLTVGHLTGVECPWNQKRGAACAESSSMSSVGLP